MTKHWTDLNHELLTELIRKRTANDYQYSEACNIASALYDGTQDEWQLAKDATDAEVNRDARFEYKHRRDNEGGPAICHCCLYPGKLRWKELDCGHGKFHAWVCEVCSETFLEMQTTHPRRCSDPTLYRAIAHLGNMILSEIRELKEGLKRA